MGDEYFSTDHEPALGRGPFQPDPAERRAASTDRPPSEMESLRDSIAAEPALPQHSDPDRFSRWLQQKRSRCSLWGDLGVTILAASLSGPFAIVGAFMAGRQTASGHIYAVVFGPVVEELLKQSGMTYLLEKKPYRLFAPWQFLFAALVAGLTFAAIENLVYIHLYAPASGVKDVARLAAFRWTVCTSLHVVCAVIASLGLVRAWKRQVREALPPDLTAALPWFAAAIAVHALYNCVAMFIQF